MLALKYRAEFDLLTDLYNMHTFYSQAAQAVHAYPERRYSIVRMDIDRFKVINDLYGLKEGDKLLIAIADLLREKMADNRFLLYLQPGPTASTGASAGMCSACAWTTPVSVSSPSSRN